jgi:hypothetical protein
LNDGPTLKQAPKDVELNLGFEFPGLNLQGFDRVKISDF